MFNFFSNKKLTKQALFGFAFIIFFPCIVLSQNDNSNKNINDTYGTEIRAKNSVTVAAGGTIPNGDFSDPELELSFYFGYKRFINPYFNINIGYHKYNIAFKDIFNEGFMSFDINLEVVPMGKNVFTPFVYVGGGYNASNYFKATEMKVQGGGGFEVMIYSSIGLNFFAEYNHMFSDELDGVIFGAGDDSFIRGGIGLNFYFGKRGKNKLPKDVPTVINSNPIIQQ